MHYVPIVNEQITLQNSVRVVPMPLIDPNGSNRRIQKTIDMMGKTKEI